MLAVAPERYTGSSNGGGPPRYLVPTQARSFVMVHLNRLPAHIACTNTSGSIRMAHKAPTQESTAAFEASIIKRRCRASRLATRQVPQAGRKSCNGVTQHHKCEVARPDALRVRHQRGSAALFVYICKELHEQHEQTSSIVTVSCTRALLLIHAMYPHHPVG